VERRYVPTIPSFRTLKKADFGHFVRQWAPLGCLIRVCSLVGVVSWGIGHQNGGLASASFCGRSLIKNIFINLITFSSTIHTFLILIVTSTKENIASDTKKTCFWHEHHR
jgi:hypothetical protein